MKKAVFIVFAVMLFAFGVVSSAMAIDGLARDNSIVVNPGALGDSLIYGYYNVRGNINLFNIINTSTGDGAKVRVVFRAGKTSEEVLDFSVCLSKNDVWTAFIEDIGTNAAICGFDQDTVTAPGIPTFCQPFKIPTGSSLTSDDLREGYFEVLGLSSIPGYDKNASDASTTFGITGNYIKTAGDCASWCSVSGGCVFAGSVGNVLMGNQTIAVGDSLKTFSYNATALGFTSEAPFPDPGPGSEVDVTQLLGSSCSGVELALSKTEIVSPYDIIGQVGETELIITFPTRRACHLADVVASPGIFNCVADNSDHTKCVTYSTPVTAVVYDDKEHVQNILDFSPAGANALANEVNVINVGGSSDIWDSTLEQSFSVSIGNLGWLDLVFTSNFNDNEGLPLIAYTTQSLNGTNVNYMVPTGYKSFFAPLIP